MKVVVGTRVGMPETSDTRKWMTMAMAGVEG